MMCVSQCSTLLTLVQLIVRPLAAELPAAAAGAQWHSGRQRSGHQLSEGVLLELWLPVCTGRCRRHAVCLPSGILVIDCTSAVTADLYVRSSSSSFFSFREGSADASCHQRLASCRWQPQAVTTARPTALRPQGVPLERIRPSSAAAAATSCRKTGRTTCTCRCHSLAHTSHDAAREVLSKTAIMWELDWCLCLLFYVSSPLSPRSSVSTCVSDRAYTTWRRAHLWQHRMWQALQR